jgi:hypothetical protein
MMGGNRIYNPSIAIVKIKYEKFLDYYNNHKNLQVTTRKLHDKVAEMREKADILILHIWNEVEKNMKTFPLISKETNAPITVSFTFSENMRRKRYNLLQVPNKKTKAA